MNYFWGGFSQKIRFGFAKDVLPKILQTNSAAYFAGKFRQLELCRSADGFEKNAWVSTVVMTLEV